MRLFYKLCRQNPETRDGVVMATSILGIVVNLAMAAAKIAVGILATSIAVISEGVNNATDSATSLITIVGTKLSKKRPTKKHPFGYGRIEYLTSMVISTIILFTGLEFLTDSVKLILNPEQLNISTLTIVVLGVSAGVKLALGSYTSKMGKKVKSSALEAVGADCKNDCLVSGVTIASAFVFLILGVSIDAYAGVITSVFILKTGYDTMKGTVAFIIGEPADAQLAGKLYKEIRETPCVLNVADMMLHNYGPDTYSGSVNIEIDHEKRIGEVYEEIHALQLKIMRKYGVTMVLGMYAVDSDHENVKKIRKAIGEFVRGYEHAVSFHALYLPPESDRIYCDIVVDYNLKDWEKLRQDFIIYMDKKYPRRQIELVIETQYV